MASNQPLPVSPSKGVPPLFLKASTLATPADVFINGLDICYALESITGKNTVDCVQRMGNLYRIYTKTLSAREDLLINGFIFNNTSVSLLARNPFQVKDQQVPSTKLIIGGVPMSVADSEIERALLDLNIKMLSELKYETYRDADGKWTHFKTGRRFVYIELPQLNLDCFVKIGLWKASLYYRQQIRPRKQNNNSENVTKGLADPVSTEESVVAPSSNQMRAGSAEPIVQSSESKDQPGGGKSSYSNLASKSHSDLWKEANGKGETTDKTPVKSAKDSRRGRTLSRNKNRHGKLSDHWSPIAHRSASAKRKVGDSSSSFSNNTNMKHRKTSIPSSDSNYTAEASSPSQSTEESGLC